MRYFRKMSHLCMLKAELNRWTNLLPSPRLCDPLKTRPLRRYAAGPCHLFGTWQRPVAQALHFWQMGTVAVHGACVHMQKLSRSRRCVITALLFCTCPASCCAHAPYVHPGIATSVQFLFIFFTFLKEWVWGNKKILFYWVKFYFKTSMWWILYT